MNSKALQQISYGMYVIGASNGDRLNAQIANTVVQVCSDPPTISVCINKNNLTHEFIQASKAFSVSILNRDVPLSFIGRFGFKTGRNEDKFQNADFKYKLGETKSPVVMDHALAYLEARVNQSVDTKTHTIFVGEVVAAEVLQEGEPMTYAYYHEVKRGSIPKTAPHYVEEKKESRPRMGKYRCTVCGWIYDPEKGDPDGGIAPGVPFEKLPDGWVCPVCGAPKDQFEKEV